VHVTVQRCSSSGGALRRRLSRRGLGLWLRLQPKVREDLLDHRPLQDGRNALFSASKKLPVISDSNWPANFAADPFVRV
jgi:hypothetical protein